MDIDKTNQDSGASRLHAELEEALRTVAKWLNEEAGEPPRKEIAQLCAAFSVPRLLTSVARRKLAELECSGFRVSGVAVRRGNEDGLIDDFGRVLWVSSNV